MAELQRIYTLGRQQYELLHQARYYDEQHPERRDEMAVFKKVGHGSVFVMPLAAFLMKMDNGIDKVSLYQKRFAARRDVYAERYHNNKLNKDIYGPQSSFSNGQKVGWAPLTPTVISQHLAGKIFIGLYPLLPDDMTNFLALDVDKHNWQEIAHALQNVCNQYHVPYLLERSQSGNGCHLWIFFTDPITAMKARQLGRGILTAAMTVAPSISFAAFDRMFPSQDFAANNGPGNLIAAPLQGKRVAEDKTVFLDETLHTLPDQWQALSAVHTLTEAAADAAISQLAQDNGYLTYPETADAQLQKNDLLTLPKGLAITEDSELHIAKTGLNKRQLVALKWLATFDNPVFYKKQKSRLSTYNTPRLISLATETAGKIVLPRGLKDYLSGIIPGITWHSKTSVGQPLKLHFTGTLRPEQTRAQTAMLAHDTGILAARTGFGKTVVAASLIAQRAVSTLILVNNKGLADQWRTQLSKFLTIETEPLIVEKTPKGHLRKKEQIGRYYGTVKNRSGVIDIATLQTLARMDTTDVRKFLAAYGQIIIDEVHHIPAFTYEQVLKEASARYLYGLSATPYREDGLDPIITMRVGPIRYHTDAIDPAFAQTVQRTVYPRFTSFGALAADIQSMTLAEVLSAMGEDAERNQLIVQDVSQCANARRHILVLTQRVAHAKLLSGLLQAKLSIPVHTLYGQQEKQHQSAQRAAVTDTSQPYCLVATGSYVGEGFDVSTIDTLVLALPVAGKSVLTQYLGRMQRSLAEKPELRVYDYVDGFLPMLGRMYHKRLRTYRGQGYTVVEDASTKRLQSQFFDGSYWTALAKDIDASTQRVLLTGNRLHPDDVQACLASLPAGRVLTIFGNKLADLRPALPGDAPIVWQDAHRGVPTALLIDDGVLWLFADQAFGKNTGIAFRVANAQLARAVLQLLGNTDISLDL